MNGEGGWIRTNADAVLETAALPLSYTDAFGAPYPTTSSEAI